MSFLKPVQGARIWFYTWFWHRCWLLVQFKELLKIFPSKRQNFPYARRNFWEMANFQRKKLITLSNGQIWVHMQRICNVWVTNTPSIMSKRAHLSVGSSNQLNCPLRDFGEMVDFQRKGQKLRYLTDRYEYTRNAYAIYGSQTLHQ